ncbi:MAG: hypothetical protein ACFFE2_06670 [Candidatus Thorarchaeota archaeon]
MSELVNFAMMVALTLSILVILVLQPKTGFATIRMKMKKAIPAQWEFSEFIKLKPNKLKTNQYYSFSEETVRSLGHRYIGRFDGAVLHWETKPVLDFVIEFKFPVKQLPERARKEDVFQSGLYALALMESGVSCSSSKLVSIYCLQDKAERCLTRKSNKDCWRCRDGKMFVTKFNHKSVLEKLKQLDQVWYEGRRPRPSQDIRSCSVCPYSNGRCNYALT